MYSFNRPNNKKNGTVSVQKVNDISGHIVIPELVTHNENNYDVTTISMLGFSSSGEIYTGDLIIPRSIISIGMWAFNLSTGYMFENSNLLTINSSVQNIPQFCFEMCLFKNIKILSDTIEKIDSACFRGNNAISSIEIPSNITSVDSQAFYNCNNLSELILFSESIMPYASDMLGLTKILKGEGKIYVRPELIDQYKTATGWSAFAKSFFSISIDSVDLDQTSIKAYINDQPAKLTATVVGGLQKVNWSSSNELIVSVDQNGQLAYNGVGKATIRVESSFDSTKFATCEIQIDPLVESITLDQTNIKASVNDQPIKLNATVQGDYKDVTWSSSDESIVSVNENGQLAYINAGKATITAVSDVDSSKFATCEVEITEPEPQPEPEKPSNNLALILGLSLGLGIPAVAGLGFGTYYFINKNKK